MADNMLESLTEIDEGALHDALYLSYSGMDDLDADRGLHRTLMELVASRVSLLNDCFY